MTLISRMPVIAISRVRGIGVADIDSTSTLTRIALSALLVVDAEALLLVDDHQAQVLELDLLAEQPVGADHDVDLAGGQAVDDLRASASLWKRDSCARWTGKPANREANVW